MVELRSPQRSTLESVLLLFVFVAILVFMVNSYTRQQRLEKERSMIYELTLLRQGVATFNIVEKRLPKSLIELATAVFKLPGEGVNHRFVERVNVNDQGKIIDPFNNPFAYNESKGWISSTTKNYEIW
ncbi:MAG: hypothetical protein WC956_02025 [bacterium]